MEAIIKVSWASLALLHVGPALCVAFPSMGERLYGVPLEGELGLLLHHRSVLFLAVFLSALFAFFDVNCRQLAAIVVGVSMIGFLVVYFVHGLPTGPLARVARIDLIGLLPLSLVWYDTFRQMLTQS